MFRDIQGYLTKFVLGSRVVMDTGPLAMGAGVVKVAAASQIFLP